MSQLTTHVLDTATGIPGSNIRIRLYRQGETVPLADVRTTANGRCAAPLLQGEAFTQGCYRLVFSIGDYYRANGTPLAEPPFIDDVEIAFGIANPGQHYHVPLLITPWSYSTYRGS